MHEVFLPTVEKAATTLEYQAAPKPYSMTILLSDDSTSDIEPRLRGLMPRRMRHSVGEIDLDREKYLGDVSSRCRAQSNKQDRSPASAGPNYSSHGVLHLRL
jgi:hypothetical protein